MKHLEHTQAKPRTSRLARLSMIVSCCVWAACGGTDDPLITGSKGTTPTARLGGMVVDATTRLPLADVNIVLIAGAKRYPPSPEKPLKTDEQGQFNIEKLPSGSWRLIVEGAREYMDAEIPLSVDAEAGGVPVAEQSVSVGPIGLVPRRTEEVIAAQLVNQDGSPVANTQVFVRFPLEWIDFADDEIVARGVTIHTTSTDDEGKVLLSSTPDFQKLTGLSELIDLNTTAILIVPPVDGDNDGIYETLGAERRLPRNILGAADTLTIKLEPADVGELAVISSYPTESGTTLLPGDVAQVTYSLPLDEQQTTIELLDEKNQPAQGAELKLSDNHRSVQLPVNSLTASSRFTLKITAVSDINGQRQELETSFVFFSPTPTPSTVTASYEFSESEIFLQFSEAIGPDTPFGGALTMVLPIVFIDADLNYSEVIGDSKSEHGYRAEENANVELTNIWITPAEDAIPTARWRVKDPFNVLRWLDSGTQTVIEFSRVTEHGAVRDSNGTWISNVHVEWRPPPG